MRWTKTAFNLHASFFCTSPLPQLYYPRDGVGSQDKRRVLYRETDMRICNMLDSSEAFSQQGKLGGLPGNNVRDVSLTCR